MQNLQLITDEEREKQYEMADVEGLHRDEPELSPLEELLAAANIGVEEKQELADSDSDENNSDLDH